MHIQSEKTGEFTVVSLEGKLDTNTADEAEQYLNKLLEDGITKLLVDFEKLDFISSAGLRILLSTAKKLKAKGGDLRLCTFNETVQDIFEISGFNSLLNVFASREAALSSS